MDLTRRQQLRAALDAVPAASHTEWVPPLEYFRSALASWREQRCTAHRAAWAGVRCLHRDYLSWCEQVAREVPCSSLQFLEWLVEEGFVVEPGGLVYGVILREDLRSVREDV